MRRLALTPLLAIVLVSPAVHAADAPTADAPTFVVGDEWRYSDGRQHRVVVVGDDLVVVTGPGPCRKCRYVYDRSLLLMRIEQEDGTLFSDRMPLWLRPEIKLWTFPLEVTKSWKSTASILARDRLVHRVEVVVTVEAFEDVATQAGTFKAFRVKREWKTNLVVHARDRQFTETVWFSPAVKWVVKFQTGNTRAKDWELVSYTVK
jgi:hypothetical protein